MDKLNLAAAFRTFDETWSPRIAGEVSGFHVKLAKFEGEFIWHSHAEEDELFLVVEGKLTIRLRDRDISLGPGELFIVPHGTEHLPVAEPVAHVLLFEPASTLNTGNISNERTVEVLQPLPPAAASITRSADPAIHPRP